MGDSRVVGARLGRRPAGDPGQGEPAQDRRVQNEAVVAEAPPAVAAAEDDHPPVRQHHRAVPGALWHPARPCRTHHVS